MTSSPPPRTEADEIAADARRERRLIPQALISLGIIVVIVVLREVLLR